MGNVEAATNYHETKLLIAYLTPSYVPRSLVNDQLKRCPVYVPARPTFPLFWPRTKYYQRIQQAEPSGLDTLKCRPNIRQWQANVILKTSLI